ncbi:unnamed protein product [Dicrocoelium dendriticum]|nr:unnamed protein product [Dicrocoelium dendriticum]
MLIRRSNSLTILSLVFSQCGYFTTSLTWLTLKNEMMNCDDPFYLFFCSLGAKPSTTLRCFERGDFFALYESDAFLVAKDFFNNSSVVKHYRTEQTMLPYVMVKKSCTDFLRHFLLKRQYRLEIYCKSTGCDNENDWVLKFKSSPGNMGQLEELLFQNGTMAESSGLSAISLRWLDDQLFVSVAFCDRHSRRFAAGEFVDSLHLANLETALIQLESRECLVPAGLLSKPNLGDKPTGSKASDCTLLEHLSIIFERAGVLVTEVEKGDFALPDVTHDLKYLLRQSTDSMLKEHRSLVCLGALIKFLNLKADESNACAFKLEPFSLENYVRLDTAALGALHLLPGPDDRNRYQSVYGVLNYCRTPQGQRLLAQRLRQPLTDTNKINEKLDLVETLVSEAGVRRTLHEDFLRRMPDFQRLSRKLQKKQAAGLQDVYRIYQAVGCLPNAIALLNQCRGRHPSVVNECLILPLQGLLQDFSKFQQMIESTIDLDAVQSRNEFLVRADFDPTLSELQSRLTSLERSIENEFQRAAQKLALDPGKSVKLETNDQLGYFMRMTLKEEKILRDFKTFEILDTQKGGVRFRNSVMSQLSDEHQELRKEYTEAQKCIVEELLRVAAGYVDPLHSLNSSTAELDVIVSLAMAAVSAPGGQYVRPNILPRSSGRIIFKALRHPCLELQDAVSVIPNDVHLEREKQTFLIITGPNMGGKSTYIRAIGAITAMAQIGSFVPCSFAELIPVDAIMARIGAADCQVRGVSTFLAEMLETSSVLQSATPNSLVIIDELGRGTSTYDGFGLAWSVASHLAGSELGCFSLFATHFHELTSLSHQMPGRVATFRVTAQVAQSFGGSDSMESSDTADVIMLYKVEPGVCDRSYGLEVARLVGLPQSVIEDAANRVNRAESIESLWLKLCCLHPPEHHENHHGKRSRLSNEADHSVDVVDQLRATLISLLETALSHETPAIHSSEFGIRLAHLARDVLASSENAFPKELL